MGTILVTGATGFVGLNIVRRLQTAGFTVIAAGRNRDKLPPGLEVEWRSYDLDHHVDHDQLLEGVDHVCHAASWATMWGHQADERRMFLEPTLQLVDRSRARGVKRFILTSSIAANPASDAPLSDGLPGMKTGLWPHLDYLVDVENHLRDRSDNTFQGVSLRLGHFVGCGNTTGIVPALLPRLRTHLVPYIAGGKSRLPLIGPNDIAQAFEKSLTADLPGSFLALNITSGSHPSMKELLDHLKRVAGVPTPHYSVPYRGAFTFGLLSEAVANLSGTQPFLARSLVHLARNWETDNRQAAAVLGYRASDRWQEEVEKQVSCLLKDGVSFKLMNN